MAKRPLILFFLIALSALAFVVFAKTGPHLPTSPQSSVQTAQQGDLYMGMQKVDPATMKRLFPESVGKPFLLVFHSKFCLDCKKMGPVIDRLLPKHPKLYVRQFDVFEDKKNFHDVFAAFKPVTVPILVFITADGRIANVLYNFQPEAVIAREIGKISG